MTFIDHPWRQRILSHLPPEKRAMKIADESPLWEEVDGNIARLGSLTHGQVDIPRIQELCLTLLENESKDFRILIHLLRTLQHGGHPGQLILACTLLVDYLRHFADVAWPQEHRLKLRLLHQTLKRFETAASYFTQRADEHDRQQMHQVMESLSDTVSVLDEKLTAEVTQLIRCYGRTAATVDASETISPEKIGGKDPDGIASTLVSIEIHNDSGRAWRQSLLNVAELLCESHPSEPIGYLVRRHAIWGALNSAPASKDGKKTQLAAVAADRVADYRNRISSEPTVWKDIEISLALAPWWFDGHYLSAQAALLRGYHDVANAIRESVIRTLKRIPGAESMQFSDGTPFISPETHSWLSDSEKAPIPSVGGHGNDGAVWQEYQQQGLHAALSKLDMTQKEAVSADPRFYFYNQLTTAQLLAEAGLTELAQHQFLSLWKSIRNLSLEEWEPSLLSFIKKYIADASQGLE